MKYVHYQGKQIVLHLVTDACLQNEQAEPFHCQMHVFMASQQLSDGLHRMSSKQGGMMV
uniref:Uncharacterized protein n=1 Tax=Arundo donax TaxID=35708 RepID=A0A0A8Y4L5_ARUDO